MSPSKASVLACRGAVALTAAAVLCVCGPGSFTTIPPGDSGPGDGGDGDADVDAAAGCGGVICPSGTECIDGRCQPRDPCDGVVCSDDEVCSDGRCVLRGTDEDGDGYVVEQDCDDSDPDIVPGATIACTTGCGPGTQQCGADGVWQECSFDEDPCELPHAAAVCVDDSCVVMACADGWSNCDDDHGNGCESEGGCGSAGLTCGEALDCVLACADETCAALCAFRACSGSTAIILSLVDCGDRLCNAPCHEPRSAECAACITTACADIHAECLAAGC